MKKILALSALVLMTIPAFAQAAGRTGVYDLTCYKCLGSELAGLGAVYIVKNGWPEGPVVFRRVLGIDHGHCVLDKEEVIPRALHLQYDELATEDQCLVGE